MITEYDSVCAICGKKPKEHTHHLVYGTSKRRLSDEDGLTIPVCLACHESIHRDGVPGKMSKIMGQLEWEKEWLVKRSDLGASAREDAREAFRKRYGESYL